MKRIPEQQQRRHNRVSSGGGDNDRVDDTSHERRYRGGGVDEEQLDERDDECVMDDDDDNSSPLRGSGGGGLDDDDDDDGGDDDDDEEEEEKLILPRSVIGKVIKEVSEGTRVSSESREVIALCCHEFVNALCDKSSRLCERQHKKLIGAEHILTALKEMGLTSYVSDCEETMNAAVEEAAEKRRRMSVAAGSNGWSQDDLYRRQMELFEQAKQNISRGTPADLQTFPAVEKEAAAALDDDTVLLSSEGGTANVTPVPPATPTHSLTPPTHHQLQQQQQPKAVETSSNPTADNGDPATYNVDEFVRMLRQRSRTKHPLETEDYDDDTEEG